MNWTKKKPDRPGWWVRYAGRIQIAFIAPHFNQPSEDLRIWTFWGEDSMSLEKINIYVEWSSEPIEDPEP